MPKATAVFDADDSRLSGAFARINGKMLAQQSRIAKFAASFIAVRAAAGVVTAGFDQFKQALDVGGELNDLSANRGHARLRLTSWGSTRPLNSGDPAVPMSTMLVLLKGYRDECKKFRSMVLLADDENWHLVVLQPCFGLLGAERPDNPRLALLSVEEFHKLK